MSRQCLHVHLSRHHCAVWHSLRAKHLILLVLLLLLLLVLVLLMLKLMLVLYLLLLQMLGVIILRVLRGINNMLACNQTGI